MSLPHPSRLRILLAATLMSAALVVTGCGTGPTHTVTPTMVDGGRTTERAAAPQRPGTNVPMRRLAPGERPPQFILFSFDGVGVSRNWDLFLDTAAHSGARFSALMTGLYFLTDKAKRRYRGPGYRPGEAALAFGGTREEVKEQITYLNRTWHGGHEMGTHYVGHFCAGTRNPGRDWTTREWNHELDQFFSLMTNWRRNTGITDGPDLAFGPEVVKGGRTQCLEGTPARLFPALRSHGMTWDSSMPARRPGLFWPSPERGIWEFPIPYVYSPPLKTMQTALDYNFWVTANGGKNDPAAVPRIRRIVRSTYEYMYRRAFHGNRAPLVIANHINDWSGNAFNPATADFMRDACRRPETVCATYQDVIAWMELQDPAVLAELRARTPVAVDAQH